MAKTKRQREKSKRKLSSAKRWVEKQESGGGSLAWNLPDDMPFYKWKKGVNRLDFIAFVASSSNPNAEEGELHWEREYRVHQLPGPGGRRMNINCLSQTFGKNRCPGCELCASQIKAGESQDDVKKLEAKKRHGSLVRDLDEPDKGVQFLEYPHYKSLGEMLKDEIESAPDDSQVLEFYSPTDGMTVEIMCKEDTHEGRKYMKPYKINFKERKKQYKESMPDNVPCLDDLLNELSYKDFAAKIGLIDEEEDDEENEDKPKKKRKKGREEDDDDEDDEDDTDDEEEDEDDDDEDDVDGDDDEESDDDDDESDDDNEGDDDSGIERGMTVKTKKKVKGKFRTGVVKKVNAETGLAKVEDEDGEVFAENVKNLVEVEDEEDDDEEDEDEKPRKKKRKK